MVKWALTIGCAVALLAIAQDAAAYDFDEDGNFVFYDEDELDEFLISLVAEYSTDESSAFGGDGLREDICGFPIPEAYAVTIGHEISGNWHYHVILDVEWDSNGYYRVCAEDNEHALDNVDSVKCNWRHENGSGICNWCTYPGAWWTAYRQYDGTPTWEPMSEDEDCMIEYTSGDSIYWGEEEDWYVNYDFNTNNFICRFSDDETPPGYKSRVRVTSCPE
jgi:hypothetical protein